MDGQIRQERAQRRRDGALDADGWGGDVVLNKDVVLAATIDDNAYTKSALSVSAHKKDWTLPRLFLKMLDEKTLELLYEHEALRQLHEARVAGEDAILHTSPTRRTASLREVYKMIAQRAMLQATFKKGDRLNKAPSEPRGMKHVPMTITKNRTDPA